MLLFFTMIPLNVSEEANSLQNDSYYNCVYNVTSFIEDVPNSYTKAKASKNWSDWLNAE